jgi:uncharacterized repeat protein (TIGR03803 family)
LTATALAATEKIVHQFVPLAKGATPFTNLVSDSAGNLYGTAFTGGEYGLGCVFELSRNSGGSWKESVIYSFAGGPSDGEYPNAGVALDTAGNIYGTTYLGGLSAGTVFKLTKSTKGKWTESVIYKFGTSRSDGQTPNAGVTFDSAGNLYGTTPYGGTNSCGSGSTCGTVYELSPSGTNGSWSEKVVYNFTGSADGNYPLAGITVDAAGNLYGSTTSAIFALLPSQGNWSFEVIYALNGYRANNMTLDAQGNLYGTTYDGGTANYGTVFELLHGSNGTWSANILYSFHGVSDGGNPGSQPVFDNQGNLYGTTEIGGKSTKCSLGCGIVFRLAPNQSGGWTESTIHTFNGGLDGGTPMAGLYLGTTGNLYGTTRFGGVPNQGTVFELAPASGGTWIESIVFAFPSTDGQLPLGSLTADSVGSLYGTTNGGGSGACPYPYTQGCGTVFKLTPIGDGKWLYKVIYNFTGQNGDGIGPTSAVVLDSAGNVYGTTNSGGSKNLGTVFKLTPSGSGKWTETILYSFGSNNNNDGFGPNGLVRDSAGNLYGTTYGGGDSNVFYCHDTCGTVFELSPNSNGGWTEKILYSFTGYGDGENPQVGPTIDSNGNLYGTAELAFKLSPNSTGSWTETVISPSDFYSWSTLTFDSTGNLYGVGGPGANGYGDLFELSPMSSGPWTQTVLYSFANLLDSVGSSGVIFDSAGNLYGASESGGIVGNTCLGGPGCGTVFKLIPDSNGNWTERILYSFLGAPSDGSNPHGGLVIDPQGNLYGMTYDGGPDQYGGTVFQITP